MTSPIITGATADSVSIADGRAPSGQDVLITPGMLADRLRPIVLAGENACLENSQMIPLHRATVTAIYQHLERLASLYGEETVGGLEHAISRLNNRLEEEGKKLSERLAARRKSLGGGEQ